MCRKTKASRRICIADGGLKLFDYGMFKAYETPAYVV